MKKYILVLLLGFINQSNLFALEFGPECPETAIPEKIKDPHEWSLQCFKNFLGAFPSDDQITSTEMDLNNDGKPEKLIGKYGGRVVNYYVFERSAEHFKYLGAFDFHPEAIKIFPVNKEGTTEIATYHAMGAESGYLNYYYYDGSRFKVIRSELIYPSGKDEQLFNKLFNQ